jgi:hypothetical protein
MWTKELIAEAHEILAEMVDEDIVEYLKGWLDKAD